MSDDRLFSTNNAIGRKWYFINLAILIIITLATYFFFTKQIIPNIKAEDFVSIANWIMKFLLFIYAITFISLIDRRLYDAAGSREKKFYSTFGSLLTLLGLFVAVVGVLNLYPTLNLGGREFTFPMNTLNPIAEIMSAIFVIIIIFIGFKKGKKTGE